MADIEKEESLDLIASDKVEGTTVYNPSGEKLGSIYNFMVNKMTGRVEYAVLKFGGFLGAGSDYYPLPWELLSYDEDKGGYVVPLNKERIQNAPAYDLKDLTKHDGSLGGIREKTYSYYKVSRDWN